MTFPLPARLARRGSGGYGSFREWPEVTQLPQNFSASRTAESPHAGQHLAAESSEP